MTPTRARREESRMLPAPPRNPATPPERACVVMAAQLEALERDILAARVPRRRPAARRAVPASGEEVRLSERRTVAVRPVCPTDGHALRSLFDRLGALTRYRRFLAPIESLTPHQVAFLTQIDELDHDALLAFDVLTGEAVGVARCRREPARPSAARLAVVVTDSWQGHGVATALVERLGVRARGNGIQIFHGVTVAPNPAAHALGRRAARSLTADRNMGWSELTARLADPPRAAPALATVVPTSP